ncbi:MAG: hypothetical protein ACYC64_00260 [Armatimonadota bacterium]
MKLIRMIIAVAILGCVVCGSAPATLSWTKTFSKLYKPKRESTLKEARCAVCHVTSSGTSGLNCYGRMLEKLEIDPDSLKAVENKDADKDGARNIEEIKAGTLPGDPKSKPE